MGLDGASAGEISRVLASGEFQGKPYEMFLAPVTDRSWRAPRLTLIGGGAGERGTALIRKLAAAAGLAARQRRIARAAFAVRGTGDPLELAQAVAEGLTLAEFYGGSYKTTEPPPAAPPAWTVVVIDADDQGLGGANAAVARGRILGECSNLARELANEPGNTLTPREFAKRAAALASDGGRQGRDSRRNADREAGDGAAARRRARQHRAAAPDGVPPRPAGRAGRRRCSAWSARASRSTPAASRSSRPRGMERMKDDMAGGAAVACAMRAIALLGAPIRVIGVVPDDREHAGRTRDQAGRRPEERRGQDRRGDQHRRRRPADSRRRALVRAPARRDASGRRRDADRRDRRRARQDRRAGSSARRTRGSSSVRRVADRAGDRVWPMPLFDEYREQLKSEIADMIEHRRPRRPARSPPRCS